MLFLPYFIFIVVIVSWPHICVWITQWELLSVLACLKICTDLKMTSCLLESNCFWRVFFFNRRLRVVIDFMSLKSAAASFENAVLFPYGDGWSFHKNMLTYYSHWEIFIFYKRAGSFYNSLQAVSEQKYLIVGLWSCHLDNRTLKICHQNYNFLLEWPSVHWVFILGDFFTQWREN